MGREVERENGKVKRGKGWCYRSLLVLGKCKGIVCVKGKEDGEGREKEGMVLRWLFVLGK